MHKTYDADFCIKIVIFGTSKSFHLIDIIHMHMNTDFCLTQNYVRIIFF